MKNNNLKKILCTGAMAAAFAFNPLTAQAQEKPKKECKIDLNLDADLEKKIVLPPIFSGFNAGDFNLQLFMPRVYYQSSFSDKIKIFTEFLYLQKESESGIGINARFNIQPFELSLGGYFTLSDFFHVGKYGFNLGTGLDLKDARFGIGYQFDAGNEIKEKHTISVNAGFILK